MSRLKLKICGLRENAEEVLEAIKPDFAGFIYYDKSPRYIKEPLSDLRMVSPVKKVGVFVNADFDSIVNVISSQKLEVVQLHGDESQELCGRLKARVEVIKVFSGNQTIDEERLKSYEPHVDYFLFDTRGEGYGGSGISFDWKKMEGLTIEKPIILSGGISLKDVEQIKRMKNIYAIDVNSKFEVKPGLKDIDLLRKLKEELR